MRDIIILSCTKCKLKNYTTTKNKKNQPQKVEYKKFCPKCNARTIHKEGK